MRRPEGRRWKRVAAFGEAADVDGKNGEEEEKEEEGEEDEGGFQVEGWE